MALTVSGEAVGQRNALARGKPAPVTRQTPIGAQLLGIAAVRRVQTQCLDVTEDGFSQLDGTLVCILTNQGREPTAQFRRGELSQIIDIEAVADRGHGVSPVQQSDETPGVAIRQRGHGMAGGEWFSF